MKEDKFGNLHWEHEELRALGYEVIDMITEYYDSINDVRVFPNRNNPDQCYTQSESE